MNLETYLTQTIQKAVKEAIREEFEELKEAIIHTTKYQSRPIQSRTSTSSSEIIRPKELSEMLSLSIPTIYRMYNDEKLPPKVKMGSRAVGWLRSDIEDWLISRKQDE